MAEFEKENKTATGESLDKVLDAIRETVNQQADSGPASLARAFGELRQEITRLSQQLKEPSSANRDLDAESLEAMITKIAQPMLEVILTNWVDKNLPTLAEHVVREQIEKISREVKP